MNSPETSFKFRAVLRTADSSTSSYRRVSRPYQKCAAACGIPGENMSHMFVVIAWLVPSGNQSYDMNKRQNSCKTNLVLLHLGLAVGCAKLSLPIGDDPIWIHLFRMSQLKV